MRSTVEPLEGNKVKLSVEVDETEFDKAIDAAFRRLGRQVRIPGFRPGKAPRRLLEARMGTETARQEALRESLPDFYEQALREHHVEAIAPPEIDITAGREEGPVTFDAVVEVMPEIRVAGYEGLRVALPNLEVTEAEVDAQIDRLREQFAELRPVDRQARAGDHVSIDRKVTRHDEVLLTAEDELYEVGSQRVVAELDDQLRGARAGDILKFNATLPGQGEATFSVLVKEVREKVLPEVTDEWAGEASEFETVEELRADIRSRSDAVKRLEAALAVREKVMEALVELVDDEMPRSLVAAEMERRQEVLVHRLGHQGIDLEQYLQLTGMSTDQFFAQLEQQSVAAIKADLALRYVAEAEGVEVTDEDVEQEIAAMAQRQGVEEAKVRRALESEGRLPEVLSGVRKSKALEWLIEHTEYVDEDGRVIERSELQPPSLQSPDRGPDADEGQQEQETPE
ncbi:MAG TPA: trigger factor [Acidimicrobiales bacterium]|nr:trigger factor [Acidimicrobiales bacterium]